MTRYPYGTGGVLEEDIPGEIDLTDTFLIAGGSDVTHSNANLGSSAESRKSCVGILFRKSGVHATSVKLDGFDLTKIGSKELTVSGGNYVIEFWYIDAGTGSLLDGATNADLRIICNSSTSPSQLWVHVFRIEHAPNPRFLAFSSGTSNNRGVTLPAKKNNVAAASIVTATAGVTFSWSGLTKVADYFISGVYFLSAAIGEQSADGDVTALCNISSSVGNAEGAILFDKLDNPTYEKTDDDTQTSVTGDTMTSTGLDIGSGDDRTIIVAQAFMGQDITFASIKCNGVSMHLAAKANATIPVGGRTVSACQFYLRRDELPDPSSTTATFETKIASGNCNAVLVIGCVRGGQGVLSTTNSGTGSGLAVLLSSPGGPHVSVFGLTIPKTPGGNSAITYDPPLTVASTVYEKLTGCPSDNFMVATGKRELSLPFDDANEVFNAENSSGSQGGIVQAFAHASYI